ncbi:Biotin carboxylase / Biotin carboxyl carrier protein [Alteromonas macleodii]|uniref:acetyl/propionyl/methylcrotonyl-CoA carboxylase subunit alpha n=1 Tax=Alteromonas sp. BZK5 TaxID=1904459 RepID=UPI001653D937|nr:acetyl-CoA carboxylase biotin carboxylase subunit [Alteromonas sp. BZK5]MBC6985390.1 acetyl-CoA carboxylase biotin carboxylase subunit [Alteromonas sp. BZK5]
MTRNIQKILIANRGEIACRIIRTAHKLGFFTVAIYSEADRNALHVLQADEAVFVGPADPTSSYLHSEKVINAAIETQADAIHPGYGFLSENTDFARACEDAGLTFIGPNADAIALMGSKRLSKIAMLQANVPCIPGYEGGDQSEAALIENAKNIGFPLMVKASAGGGGKGMRLVHEASDLAAHISTARSEALNAFGNDELILERALIAPRHIEIQIFADGCGNTLYLGERDCSIQRRHQKVIEEAPSPFVDEQLRKRMGEAAVAAAKACNYCGAGTVEFLVDSDKQFYFLEMNTRLQVEHPVTELVTGLDLVEWQLRVACKESLPFTQEDIQISGHAIEVRLYAEEPRQNFMPQTGKVKVWKPATNARTDHGVYQNMEVSSHYDPMLAKIIVKAESRASAVRKMARALRETQIIGINTNKHFLQNLVQSSAFLGSDVTTAFIEQHAQHDDMKGSLSPSFSILAKAALLFALTQNKHASALVHDNALNKVTPTWQHTMGFAYPIIITCNDVTASMTVTPFTNHYRICDTGTKTEVTLTLLDLTPQSLVVEADKLRSTASYAANGNTLFIDDGTGHFMFSCVTHSKVDSQKTQSTAQVNAVMDGVIVALLVEQGGTVNAGDTVAIMEAMKMEHPLKAAIKGTVHLSPITAGDQVKSKQTIATILQADEVIHEQK